MANQGFQILSSLLPKISFYSATTMQQATDTVSSSHKKYKVEIIFSHFIKKSKAHVISHRFEF